MTEKEPSGIVPIFVPKASDILAARLRDLILAGKFVAGDMLPAERELVAESGLSRASVREALRVLEAENLVTTRPGRLGGSMVTLPGRKSVARSVELFIRTHGIRLESLLDCRLAVEPMMASLAAVKRSPEELAEMERLHEAFLASDDDVAAYKQINLEWHLAVARASQNEPLIALMEAISGSILKAADYQQVTTEGIRHEAFLAHTRIMKAITRGDAELAFKSMERHVSAYSKVARECLNRQEVSANLQLEKRLRKKEPAAE